ncbi:Peptidase inhibitor I78 family protein [Rhodobacteraceae bacterium THAF1]|nr:Peptidase inhibitor I78 family protein [Rhodobacteraceae bacterium THAF1]
MAGMLAACQPEPPAPTETSESAQPKGKAEKATEDLSGCAPASFNGRARMGTPVDQIDATGPDGRRVIRPGQMVTMDYLAGRLNLVVDGAGNLTRAYCG